MKRLPETHQKLVSLLKGHLSNAQWVDAANLLADVFGLPKLENERESIRRIEGFIKSLLDGDYLIDACALLWPESIFDPRPQSVQNVWKFFDETNLGLIIGAASMGKSYTLATRLFLEWLRDPQYTIVRVIAPTEDHLVANLFSQLAGLHKGAYIKLPGIIRRLYIGLDNKDTRASIRGVLIPHKQSGRAGRLQGVKRFPRPEPHPKYGALARLFIFVDEFENVSPSIWFDLDNIVANMAPNDPGFKLFGAYNPTDLLNELYRRAEPEGGWSHFDIDADYRWKSKRGWDVLRLDAYQCENVKEGRVIYPGLQTVEGIRKITQDCGGDDTPGYYAMVRGAYPVIVPESTLISAETYDAARGKYEWVYGRNQVRVAGVDLALEGKTSRTVIAIGTVGWAKGYVKVPREASQKSVRVSFVRDGRPVQFIGVQLDALYELPPNNTIKMKQAVVEMLNVHHVKPENVAVDTTGAGRGVADLMKEEWGPIITVNFSGAATGRRIMVEDQVTTKDTCAHAGTEIWVALKYFLEFGYLLISPDILDEELRRQVISRRYRMTGPRIILERKIKARDRLNQSPDHADAVALLVHAARVSLGLVPSMRPGKILFEQYSGSSSESLSSDIQANIAGSLEDDRSWLRVDPTNKFEPLEAPSALERYIDW